MIIVEEVRRIMGHGCASIIEALEPKTEMEALRALSMITSLDIGSEESVIRIMLDHISKQGIPLDSLALVVIYACSGGREWKGWRPTISRIENGETWPTLLDDLVSLFTDFARFDPDTRYQIYLTYENMAGDND